MDPARDAGGRSALLKTLQDGAGRGLVDRMALDSADKDKMHVRPEVAKGGDGVDHPVERLLRMQETEEGDQRRVGRGIQFPADGFAVLRGLARGDLDVEADRNFHRRRCTQTRTRSASGTSNNVSRSAQPRRSAARQRPERTGRRRSSAPSTPYSCRVTIS